LILKTKIADFLTSIILDVKYEKKILMIN